MPQLGLLIILTIVPLEMLSGGITPRESMPQLVQNIMLAAPSTYFCPGRAGYFVSWSRNNDHLARSAGDDRTWRCVF